MVFQNKLIEIRTKLQNKIRRATPAEKETLREEKAGVTTRITELRKQLKMNKAIEERSVKIQEKTDNTSNYHEERQDCFVCSNYRSNTGSCTIHYIRAVTLNRLVFKHIQGVLSYIQQFEASFVKKEREKADMQHRMSVDKAKVDIVTLKRRDEDLDTLFKRIYEDMVSGRLSAERFDKLSTEYEEEQRQVKQTIVELQTLIDNGEQNEVDLQKFLRNVRKYTDPKELTAEILNDLVDKIVIYAPDKSSGHRKQKIEIYYKAVGIINVADEECVVLDGRLGMQNRKKKTA